jgi:hypothetical protein
MKTYKYRPKKKLDTTTNNFSGDGSRPEVNLLDTACHSSNVDETFVNYKNILQSHLIDSIVKDGVDFSLFWSLVDPSKLASGVKSFMSAIQKQRSIKEAERPSSVNIPEEHIELPDGLKLSAFPSLSKHGVPLIVSSIHALLRDIYYLSQKAINVKLFAFPNFNGILCSLIHVPSSRNYYRFNQNAKYTGWVKSMLLAAVGGIEKNEEVAACFLLEHLGSKYSDAFALVASRLGLLLCSKKLDAESAAAMWQEANCPIRTQRIILRYLFHFFGRRITFPEQKMIDLEQGAVHPITDSALIGGKEIFFWYKEIDKVIISRLKREVLCRGRAFFYAKATIK